MELFHIDLRAAVLHRQDGRRLARAPGVEKHNLAVQVMEQLGPPLEPPHTDAIVLPEAKLADAPVRRDVLVLLADGLAAKLNLDLAGFPGQLFRGHQLAREACEIDRKSTRLNSSHLVISYAVF